MIKSALATVFLYPLAIEAAICVTIPKKSVGENKTIIKVRYDSWKILPMMGEIKNIASEKRAPSMAEAARPFKAMDSFRSPPKNARFLATDASIPRGAIMLNRAISVRARVNSPPFLYRYQPQYNDAADEGNNKIAQRCKKCNRSSATH